MQLQAVVLLLIIVFGFVGIVRGFLKELGVTLVLIATLFAVDQLIPIITGFVNNGGLQWLGLGPVQQSPTTQKVLYVLFSSIMFGAAFISYQGETLTYEGKQPSGILGWLLSFMVGAVNGYLLFGTLWNLGQIYSYPFGIVQLTPEAQPYIGLLPLNLLGGGAEAFGTFGLLPFILVLLVILKVIR